MNAAHLHLALNHLPIVGIVFASGTLLAGFVMHSQAVTRVALWLIAASAVLVAPAYLTGEPADDVLARVPGVTESVIEPHEEAALFTVVSLAVAGTAALASLVRGRRGRFIGPVWVGVVGLACLFAIGGGAYTAALGGRIRHPELRGGWTPSAGSSHERD